MKIFPPTPSKPAEKAARAPGSRSPALPKGKPHAKLPGEIRIIGGLYKRTKLAVPDRPGLRPTPAELQAAKDNLIGGFALRIDSNRKLLDNIAAIAWNDLALDYLDTWTKQIDKVTLVDIKAAFARKVQPEKMVTVVLGAAP